MSDHTTWETEVRKLVQDSEKARKALDRALEAETTTRYTCACGRKNDVPVKDTTNAVRAADIWFRQGAELAKHLERLQPKASQDTDLTRPLREWPTEALVERLRELGGSLEYKKA